MLQITGQAASAAAVTADTELPAAAALSDTTGNPTTPMVGSALMSWDGTQWRRVSAAQVANISVAKAVPVVPCLVDQASTAYPLRRTAEIGDADPAHFYSPTANMLYNGATWDRVRGDTANGVDVDVTHGTTGSMTSVASTTTPDTTLLAAGATRRGVIIYNESSSVLWILLGAGTESTTVYTTQIAANGYYQVPDMFVGLIIKGHWTSANGSARITTVI